MVFAPFSALTNLISAFSSNAFLAEEETVADTFLRLPEVSVKDFFSESPIQLSVEVALGI